MRRPTCPATAATLVLMLQLAGPAIATASTSLACKDLEVDGHTFDLSPLKGPHTVVTSEYAPPSYYNRTYTLDICAPLERKGDVEERFKCPEGTRVCQIKHHWEKDKKSTIEEVIPIAGELKSHGGGAFEWEATRIKSEDDEASGGGIKLTLKGGMFELREQRAVVQLRCNKTVSGTDNEWESEDEYVKGKRQEGDKKGDKGVGEPEHQLRKEKAELIWEGYKREGNTDTLYLTWYTKHVCESAAVEEPPADQSHHWGFFTWIVVLAFLVIATYLIFGSWLNYNRYSARGWDLLPHGDTLRDLPYLLKDWIRRVLNTVQSSGSRGGYSAV